MDIYFGTSGTGKISAKDYQSNDRSHLAEIYESVRTHLNIRRGKMKKQYDQNVNHQNYDIGDEVWLKKKKFKMEKVGN